uniref:Uncharacterized protein n=1 Tax=Cucumis melo TaxID=3656 RepID=A0A9I9D489_CUCME
MCTLETSRGSLRSSGCRRGCSREGKREKRKKRAFADEGGGLGMRRREFSGVGCREEVVYGEEGEGENKMTKIGVWRRQRKIGGNRI